jgi:hypothetical protein
VVSLSHYLVFLTAKLLLDNVDYCIRDTSHFTQVIMEKLPSTNESAKKQLFEELTKSCVNLLRVRALCRDYPGIIATTGLRIRIWTLFLLGPDYRINADRDGESDISMPEERCDEQQVLEADGKGATYIF